MKKLLQQKSKIAAAAIAILTIANAASAAGPEPVAIYKVTTVSKYLVMGEETYRKGAIKDSYFLIVDRAMQTYRKVTLFSSRKYRADEVQEWFSQSFVSTDPASRERRVISFSGPGLEWDVRDNAGSDEAKLETLIGGVKTIQTRLLGARLEMRMPTALKGSGRLEYSHLANRRREIETSKTTIRLSRRLTDLANAQGGGLASSQRDVVDYLITRGWTNIFPEIPQNGNIQNIN